MVLSHGTALPAREDSSTRVVDLLPPMPGFCPGIGICWAHGDRASNSIEAVLRGIEEELGQPLQLPPLPPDIRPFPHEGEKPQLFGSTTAIEGRLYLAQRHIRSFLAEAPDGYLVLGFWGYGINSYSFYYCSAVSYTHLRAHET